MNHLNHLGAITGFSAAPKLWLAAGITLVFAGFGRLVRGVTNSGALAGAMVCFGLLLGSGWGGFAALVTVFLLTWTATRFGYARKQVIGIAEARSGRNAGQVLANLGVAACAAILLAVSSRYRFALAVGAALCEAAADTVSSEVGQADGGKPRLITNWRRVESGTDGAITAAGTMAGCLAAVTVAAFYSWLARGSVYEALVCAGAGIAGTIADSLLGATVEGRGGIGNNTVNFLSTLIAAGIAYSTWM